MKDLQSKIDDLEIEVAAERMARHWSEEEVKKLQKRYDDLAKEFDRAINYIKMTRKFSDNAED